MTPSRGSGELAAIDAELDGLDLPETAGAAANPSDDQATALRRLVREEQPGRLGRTTEAERWGHGSQDGAGEHGAARTSAQPTPRFVPDRAQAIRTARRARVVAIASGKGGVGKTNIAVNTAIALARCGLRVTLLDADLGTANADVLCGIMPAARLDHVLAPGGLRHQDAAARTLLDIAVEAPGGFTLVPGSAGIGRMADLTAIERRWLVAGLNELAARADVVLIDAAAGVGQGVTSLLHAADLALVVTTPEPTAVADAYALIKCLVMEGEGTGLEDEGRIALVLNQVAAPVEAFATHARIARVCDRFLGLKLPMLGFVAQDVRVADAVRAQVPLQVRFPEAPAARGVSELAGAIVNILGVRARGAEKHPDAAATGERSRGVGAMVRRLLGMSPGSENPAQKS